MAKETFRRGQVEWALWCFMASDAARTGPPAKAFLTRIKRLLEIDRAEAEGRPGLAFTDVAPEGQGTDRAFTAFDAFCLALALELIDTGFKQSEVVFLLQHVRNDLHKIYRKIMRRAEPTRRRVLVHKYKEAWPTYEVNSSERVDFRMFMLIRKVEMTELFPRLSEQGAVKDPVFLPPAFCGGIKALCDHLNDRKNAYRKAMMLEIGEVARRVATCLTLVPAIKRGRR